MARKWVNWRLDPAIQARMRAVQSRYLLGQPNTQIARVLNVDERTIRRDIERLSELNLEYIKADGDALRAAIVAELEDVRKRALSAAEFDEAAERAVLTGDIDDEIFPDARSIRTDDKGSAQFRGNKAAALKVASDASMSKAKVLGLVIDKQEQSGQVTRRVVILDGDGAGSGPAMEAEGRSRPALSDGTRD